MVIVCSLLGGREGGNRHLPGCRKGGMGDEVSEAGREELRRF